MNVPPQTFVAALQDAGSAVAVAGKVALEKAFAKELRPLGHELALWREAIHLLRGRLGKGKLGADLAAFVTRWLPAGEPAPLPEKFSLLLGQSAAGELRLHDASVPFATDPGWQALLQLPALRDHWAADLRASHLEHLLKILPGAWMIDAAAMVPGTVIPGLDLADWRQGAELQRIGRSFVLRSLHDPGTGVPQFDFDTALRTGGMLLVETPAAAGWWLAHYARDERGIHLTQVHLARPEGIFAAALA